MVLSKTVLRSEFNYQYHAIGIASAVRDYRIAWLLNNSLNIDFKKEEDIALDVREEAKKVTFSVYSYFKEEDRIKYLLVSNKALGGILLKGYKNIDYLLLVEGKVEDQFILDTRKRLRELPDVQMELLIEKKEMHTIEQLIFE